MSHATSTVLSSAACWLSVLAASAFIVGQQPVPAVHRDEEGLRLPALFSDHMVLQQESTVPIWGWARPGAEVAVSVPWSAEPVRGTAAADGRFRLQFTTPKADGVSFTLGVRSGQGQRELNDVVLGEVWLCSGQSNMEWPLADQGGYGGVVDQEQELAAAERPALRLFTVRRKIAFAAETDCKGQWARCTPASAASFSAVGYYLGRRLQQELTVPVGIICSAWGGTRAEAWTSPEALAHLSDHEALIAELAQATQAAASEPALRQAFWSAVQALDPVVADLRPEAAAFRDAGWQDAELPAPWSRSGLTDHDGVVWYRRTVAIPADWAGRELMLELGPIDDMDTVFFDGARLDGCEVLGRFQQPRHYGVPGDRVRGGSVVLAVRVVDTGGEGGFTGKPAQMVLHPKDGPAGESLPLHGTWRMHKGARLDQLPTFPQARVHANLPSVLYHGMLAPLVPFALRGCTWYQGESNRTRAAQYRELLPAMIRDWRALWGRELPFYLVQIAPFQYEDDTGEAAELRDAQAAALSLPATGMVVTMDIGEPRDIHPRHKREVGERLALQALRNSYGRTAVVCDGPTFASVAAEDGALRVRFGHTDGGLRAGTGGPKSFEVAAQDGVFHAARASIDGDLVLLRCEAVPRPVMVRYAWAAAPDPAADLSNGKGLPAVPFRARL
jgi:sialate O-acetylesterase